MFNRITMRDHRRIQDQDVCDAVILSERSESKDLHRVVIWSSLEASIQPLLCKPFDKLRTPSD